MNPINSNNIVCLPDLLRPTAKIYASSFFDLVREPVWQGSGLKSDYPPELPIVKSNLLNGFDAKKFRVLANIDTEDNDYLEKIAKSYYTIDQRAENYLFDHIPKNSLIFSFEIPPWMVEGCKTRGIDFISFSNSPLRFASDLYPAIRTSNPIIYQRLLQYRVLEEEIRLEAAVLTANIRKHKLSLEAWKNYSFQNLENSLIIVGQQHIDASLLAPGGIRLKFKDFADDIKEISRGKRIFYKAHPYDLGSSQQEMEDLIKITGSSLELCQFNAYQLLSSYEDIELIGISSGLLQEAKYFDKKSYTLFQPFIPLADSLDYQPERHVVIHFQTLISPAFWHSVLAPQRPIPVVGKLPINAQNHARTIFDLWWDYSKVMTWERTLPYETVMRGGGAALRERIERLESQISMTRDAEKFL